MSDSMLDYYNNSDSYAKMLAGQDVSSYQPYAELVKRFIPSNAEMIDVGCGIGTSTLLLVESGYKILGTDVLNRFLPAPEGTFKIVDFQNASEILNNLYDAAGTMNVIEHTDHPQKFISEIVRVVKPGGHIIILAPQLTSPLVGVRILLDIMKGRTPYLGIVNPRAAFLLIFQNIWRSLLGEMGAIKFEKRLAILDTGIVGHDADAVYWTNAHEIRRFLEARNCETLLFQKQGNSAVSKFISSVLPGFAGQVCIVARKRPD
jgi:SAM-dependent methyltransferase